MSSLLSLFERELTPEQVQIARQIDENGKDIADFLLEKKIFPKEEILHKISIHRKIANIDLERYHADEKSVNKISEEVARRFSVIPIFQLQDQLYVATAEPFNFNTIDYLRQVTSLDIQPVFALRKDIESAINRKYISQEKAAQAMGVYEKEPASEKEISTAEVVLEDQDAPAIKLVNYIINHAINMGASDIHLEPFADEVSLRYRIDGALHEFPPPPFHLYRAIITRMKILSNMDVAEKRLPQDGRSEFFINGKQYDLRVSVIPKLSGESLVIRILNTQSQKVDLESLGFEDSMLEKFKKIVKQNHGILLVTGPTGSGKSTTLYSTLKYIYTPKKKIITLEDPVEYQIKGITQIQINSAIDFTFARGLRSVLRHDPDVVMLGEIRDLESAEIAIRSSLTGHMVFSTLHTNDAASAVTRLVDMGVPGFLVQASLLGVLAQRLVRRLCPHCKKPTLLKEEEYRGLAIDKLPKESTIYEPVGCQNCNNLGYKGRIGIYELLQINRRIRRLGVDELNPENIKDIAAKDGFVTMLESVREKFFQGITSAEEVLEFSSSILQ